MTEAVNKNSQSQIELKHAMQKVAMDNVVRNVTLRVSDAIKNAASNKSENK